MQGEEKNANWTEIGAMWPHSDGESYNLTLSALPIDGRLVIRTPKPKAEGTDEEAA